MPTIDDIFRPEAPPLVVAEIAQAHDGSLGTAHAYIDAAARAGAGAVKFQTHIADAESSPGEPWRVKFSQQDATRQDYWRRMEFTAEQWAGLKQHAEDKNLVFLSSPFSLKAVALLEALGMPAWKVASGEVTNALLLDAMLATGKPVLLSSGMSTLAELDAAVKRIKAAKSRVAVMQCTTSYPCPPEKTGLNLVTEFAQRFSCPAGLSDHSGTLFPSLAAVTLGARIVEVHLVFSRECFGPDASSSLTVDELATLVRGVDAIHRMRRTPVDKTHLAEGLPELRRIFGQSLVAARDLPAGTVLAKEHLTCKKPGTGIPAGEWEKWAGKKLSTAVSAGTFLKPEHFS